LQRYYNAIASGAKELRMHRPRRFRMNTSASSNRRIADIQVRSVNIYILAKTFGSMLFFVVIGLALAMQAYHPNPDPSVITGFVLVLLYMKGPLEHLLGYLPMVGKRRSPLPDRRAVQRFSSPEPHLLMDDSEAPQPRVNSLELRGVRYSPPAVAGSEPFHLGPIDLSIKQGDIVFIVGENGCGKTTLIKLLLGLYPPQAGEIRSMAVNAPNATTTASCSPRCSPITVRRPGPGQRRPVAGQCENTWNAWRSRTRSASRRIQHHRPVHRPAQAPGAGQRLAGRTPGAGVRRMGRRPGPGLPPDLLHRAAAGPQASGQDHHRDQSRRPLFRYRRPIGAPARRPGRARNGAGVNFLFRFPWIGTSH
jgi:energy-coupling factor transporter ATP-binding protein EcfA2